MYLAIVNDRLVLFAALLSDLLQIKKGNLLVARPTSLLYDVLRQIAVNTATAVIVKRVGYCRPHQALV